MTPHQITLHPLSGSDETYSYGSLVGSGRSDALRSLLRLMVARGLRGAAEVRGIDGGLRLVVRNIEAAARYTMSEEDRDGFVLRSCGVLSVVPDKAGHECLCV